MNYVNAAPSKLFAAAASAAITLVISASILLGMAGLPDHGASQQLAHVPASSVAHG